MQKQINGAILRRMLISGVKLLEINRPDIDALNVFSVPDGDTGTNMLLTMQSVLGELQRNASNSINDIAESITKGALKGARGISGVILSQFLRGFCYAIKQNEEIDAKIMSKAFKLGAQAAYEVANNPKEGTILTIIRVIGEESEAIAKTAPDLETFFIKVHAVGEMILAKTPDMLPFFKKAGVVDAGGRGFLNLLNGMYKGLIGEDIGLSDIANMKPLSKTQWQADTADNVYSYTRSDLTDKSIAVVADNIARECYGVVEVKKSKVKGVSLATRGDRICIDLDVTIKYGINISAIKESLEAVVKYEIGKFTGMIVGTVNVNILGIKL